MTPLLAVVDRTGWLPGAVRDAAQQLAGVPDVLAVPRSSDFDLGGVAAHLLVLGPKELSAAGLRRAARWSEQHPTSAVLAWLGPQDDVEPDLDALADAGVVAWWRGTDEAELVDLLDEVLAEVLAEVLEPQPAEEPAALELEPEPEPEPEPELSREPSGPAVVLSVLGSCGGAGKTFFATNMAVALAKAGKRVLLVDLDLRMGKVGSVLQARHPYSLHDGLYDAKGRPLGAEALAQHLGELVHRGPAGVDVLLAPADVTVADLLHAEDVDLLLSVAGEQYDVLVLDTAPGVDDVTVGVLDRSDVVTVLAPLDVPSLHGLRTLLGVLDRLGVDADRRRLVLNKVDTDLGLQVAQAQEVFEGAFVAQVPDDKAVPRSFNAGSPLVLTEPRSSAGKALRRAFEAVLPDGLALAEEAVVPGQRVGGSGRPGFLSRFTRTPGGTS